MNSVLSFNVQKCVILVWDETSPCTLVQVVFWSTQMSTIILKTSIFTTAITFQLHSITGKFFRTRYILKHSYDTINTKYFYFYIFRGATLLQPSLVWTIHIKQVCHWSFVPTGESNSSTALSSWYTTYLMRSCTYLCKWTSKAVPSSFPKSNVNFSIW